MYVLLYVCMNVRKEDTPDEAILRQVLRWKPIVLRRAERTGAVPVVLDSAILHRTIDFAGGKDYMGGEARHTLLGTLALSTFLPNGIDCI